MEEEKKNSNEDESSQQALEKILQAEIEVAEKITAAKDCAEKRIEAAQEEIVSLKNNIIEQARRGREEILTNGIAVTKEDAKKKIDQARIESDKFEKSGEKYIKEAVQIIEAIILGEFASEEE